MEKIKCQHLSPTPSISFRQISILIPSYYKPCNLNILCTLFYFQPLILSHQFSIIQVSPFQLHISALYKISSFYTYTSTKSVPNKVNSDLFVAIKPVLTLLAISATNFIMTPKISYPQPLRSCLAQPLHSLQVLLHLDPLRKVRSQHFHCVFNFLLPKAPSHLCLLQFQSFFIDYVL